MVVKRAGDRSSSTSWLSVGRQSPEGLLVLGEAMDVATCTWTRTLSQCSAVPHAELSPATASGSGTAKRTAVFAQSRGRSPRVDASAAVQCISSVVTSPSVALSDRGALSILNAQVSSSLVRLIWSLRWFHVCMCTDASEKGFPSAVREGCRERASEVGRVSERKRFVRSSRSVRAQTRALRAVPPEAASAFSSPEEDEVSLAWREVSLRLQDRPAGDLVTHGVFFREETITILEARSIVYAVRYAKNKYPPDRLLILSDNHALVLAHCNWTVTNVLHCFQSRVESLRLVSMLVLSYL